MKGKIGAIIVAVVLALGLFCVLVKPIKDKKTLFFRTKRLLEKPILKRYMKNQNDGEKT